MLILLYGVVIPAPTTTRGEDPYNDASGNVAEVMLTHPKLNVATPVKENETLPNTSQSPAVKLIDVIFAGVPLPKDIALAAGIMLEINSPTIPEFASLLVVVPTNPDDENELLI